MYSVTAIDLKGLYGQQFRLRDHLFEIEPQSTYQARSGLEAYVVRVRHRHPEGGPIDAALKIFKSDTPKRRERTEFLMRFAHRAKKRLFQGVPYAFFSNVEINGLRIIGHLARFITMGSLGHEGDFAELKDTWFAFEPDHRRLLAMQVVNTVAELEKEGFIHGDVSANNLIILSRPGIAPACYLCDFDGFSHKMAAQLPRRHDKYPVRPLGAEGYQYPRLIERIRADPNNSDEGVFVETDRFALAATICELMIWNSTTFRELLRGQLLSDDIITARRLEQLPEDLVRRFPRGFELLDRALKAPSIELMPSPAEWLALLSQSGSLREVAPPVARTLEDLATEDFVFISYSKEYRHLTESLAMKLEADGYSVWWDTELISGDAYTRVIVDRLNKARAVIVIWSPASIKSEWVLSEAQRARRQAKLIQVSSDGIDINDIPPPFDVVHLESLNNGQAIRKALNRYKVSSHSGKT
jgi:hypothetical protein